MNRIKTANGSNVITCSTNVGHEWFTSLCLWSDIVWLGMVTYDNDHRRQADDTRAQVVQSAVRKKWPADTAQSGREGKFEDWRSPGRNTTRPRKFTRVPTVATVNEKLITENYEQ